MIDTSRVTIINAEPEGYSPKARVILSDVANVVEKTMGRMELLTKIGQADGLIVRLGHQVDSELLNAGARLRFVATATTGLNHIDLSAAYQHGVEVLSLKGETAFLESVTATAELTWGLLLALVRHLPAAVAHTLEGYWDRDLFIGRELSGLTLGIIGYGRLGRIVAEYGKAFRMRVLAADPHPISRDEDIQYLSLNEVLASSDILSIHVALTSETKGLLGVAEFSKIKNASYLVNTSRGELINEEALLAALESGRLAGAAVDVVSNESPGIGQGMVTHPLVAYSRTHNNLLITPHIGGATSDSMHKTEVFMAKKIRSFLENL